MIMAFGTDYEPPENYKAEALYTRLNKLKQEQMILEDRMIEIDCNITDIKNELREMGRIE